MAHRRKSGATPWHRWAECPRPFGLVFVARELLMNRLMTKSGRICATLCQCRRGFVVSLLVLVVLPGCGGMGSEDPDRTSSGGAGGNSGGHSGASTGGVAGRGGVAGGSGTEIIEVGATCWSSEGLSGTVVDSSSRCYLDDAFCEPIDEVYYCTGGKPFVCPQGQVRTGWSSCGFPTGGTSSGGAGGNSGGHSGASTGGVAGGGGTAMTELGATCTSSDGLTGTVVESQSRCYLDDAFCEAIADGHYCTGEKPFVCPPGQVRTGWTTCGTPATGGGQG
jgi:hypothetical protein